MLSVKVPLVAPERATLPAAVPATPRVRAPALIVALTFPETVVPVAAYHVSWPAVPLDTVLAAGCHEAVVPFEVKIYVLTPMPSLAALFTPLPMIKSPAVVIGESALKAVVAVVCPVPPNPIPRVPASVTAPVVAVKGVRPVVPALNEVTVPAVVANVPEVGKVTLVEPVKVRVAGKAPDVAKVPPSAIDSVADVAGAVIVTLLTDVAVASPIFGAVSDGPVERTTLPEPVLVVTPVPP